MARVPLLDANDVPESDLDVLARPINLYRAFVHVPELARRYRAMGRWLRYEGNVEPRVRELVILQVAHLLGNRYEWSHHLRLAGEFGVSGQDVSDLLREETGERTQLPLNIRDALELARTLTTRCTVADDLWERCARHFDVDELVELSVVIGFYNMTARFLEGLQVDVEPSYADQLKAYPL